MTGEPGGPGRWERTGFAPLLTVAPTIVERNRVVSRHRLIASWLFLVAMLVAIMVLVGGLTRLTHSGLSIVEWQPLTGWLPPLGVAAWEAAFAHYRQFPEYQKINVGMTLAEFKGIYWLEYWHRLLGRVIGLVFAIPFVILWWRRHLDPGLVPRLLIVFALGAGQGALGWHMVQSGLVDHPDVSHYRLAAHLGLALIIYAVLLWTAFEVIAEMRSRPGVGGAALIALVLAQSVVGALVAGLDGGLAYNTWPLMGDRWVPDGLLALTPVWLNAVENVVALQFEHRLLAYMTFAVVLAAWVWARWRSSVPAARRAANWLLFAVTAQVALGIATVLYAVPVTLGVLHQFGALVVVTAAINFAYRVAPAARRHGGLSLSA